MDIKGNLTDEEFIEFIGLKITLETLNNIVNSEEYSDEDKIKLIKMFLKEA